MLSGKLWFTYIVLVKTSTQTNQGLYDNISFSVAGITVIMGIGHYQCRLETEALTLGNKD